MKIRKRQTNKPLWREQFEALGFKNLDIARYCMAPKILLELVNVPEQNDLKKYRYKQLTCLLEHSRNPPHAARNFLAAVEKSWWKSNRRGIRRFRCAIFHAPPAMLQALETAAQRDSVLVSALIRRAVEEFLGIEENGRPENDIRTF